MATTREKMGLVLGQLTVSRTRSPTELSLIRYTFPDR